MLYSLRPSSHLPLRRFFCHSSAPPDMARYREVFARRMTMAGIKPHHRIALGVSGGPDSMALCVLTAGWKSEGRLGKNETSNFVDGLLGIIVDHRLRPESTEEATQVRNRVNKIGIHCEIACCDWPDGRPKKGHLQEAAREMRYQIFQGVCIKQQIGILLVAHHADDQAELLILRLSRNSGVLGLADDMYKELVFLSMHEVKMKTCVLDYFEICQGSNQEWVEDPTNQSPLFARNRIRACLRSLSSCVFRSELQGLISACRLTRTYVDNICHQMIRHSVTIMEHGYAIVDLEKLNPSDVEDLCLSKFLALILQFISQRNRPIRGSISQLLLGYIRNIPCKTSLTAAGCYLCPAPQSKGMKILISFSASSPQPTRVELSYKCSCEEQQSKLPSEIDKIIMSAKSFSDQSVPDASIVPFMHAKSSMTILSEAKRLNLISESTFKNICLLQEEELEKFGTKTETKLDDQLRDMKPAPSITLNPGESCHFMSRFLVTWKLRKDVTEDQLSWNRNQGHLCQFCMIDQEKTGAVRHMVDADWLFLAELSKSLKMEECQDNSNAAIYNQDVAQKAQCSRYMQLSAQGAIQALKSIPVSARRALPVIVNSQGLLLSIPSICFRCCPCLSVDAVFRPRVPLGGGYSSYI
ncbi:uncharacterized protein LOC103710905 isoform X2 [Phoenix dactylifera]|uniref:tRNA(Ile)-lysidine synthetase n=1 Tax=Phoenix dactylifera TaxID=42345 RepID=A0A8B9AF56_PHODC|nr:uncharacterized protein LOC103710905 isoform X2 [Phoenix dactylifera]